MGPEINFYCCKAESGHNDLIGVEFRYHLLDATIGEHRLLHISQTEAERFQNLILKFHF